MVSIVLVLFQYKPVQTWAAHKATRYLSKELHTKVAIKSLYIKPFSSVVLEDFYVLDKQKDTLLRTPLLTVKLSGFSVFNSIKRRKLDFTLIQLDNGSFYFKKQKDSTTNLQFVIDYFNGAPDTTKKVSKPWKLNFDKIAINNFHFRYKNLLQNIKTPGQVNFDNIDVTHFTTVVTGIDLKNHLFKGRIHNLTLHEKSGFFVQNLSANTSIDTNQILLQNLALNTPHSRVKDYFRMRFKSYSDFSNFENRVRMDADLKDSRISSDDVRYFTSSLGKISFNLGVSGRVSGLVNNLTSRNLLVTGGQATYVKGNFSLKGLPDWEHTYLNLDFNQLATNKKDLDYLIGHFTGNYSQRMPDVLAKFGNVNFTGRLTGKQDNFTIAGAFKTLLGRLDPNLNLQFSSKGVPAYSGSLTATNFDLASLLDDKSLGRTTLTANVKGHGDNLKNLNTSLKADAKYFDYNGYSYQNINIDGSFKNQVANAKLKIADRNIKLNLTSNINLNPAMPQYRFTGAVTDAKLNKLHFIKDTVSISTRLNTSFHGNNVNNLQGFVMLSPTRIITPKSNYVIDSVKLAAEGLGNNRLITLQSDLADGSMKGKYDLATLPSYYKTIAKKYIPSLQTKIYKPGAQNFEFRLELKKLDPILPLINPDLKIPDRGTLVGRFNSADRTATLSGLIKTVKLGKIVFHDFIIDESTADSMLTLNLSLSRVDLTDSLYIKDINITNFLRNDSLNFNVKLSDKNAVNQLDLYGLVEFGRDTTAKLKLLPSDVILERQAWRLTEQVRIRLLNGKTQISGFELSNGEQEVRINGFVSANPADELRVEFSKFNMSTLNQLTKATDIKLSGVMNGDVRLSSVMKTPGMNADLRVDSLKMNQTLVGDVKILSDLDNSRKRANVKVNILNNGLETLDIAGAYYLKPENGNNLDFDVRMNQTEAIIFQPFVKGLVSNLKGAISTNLRLTGPVSNPKLNGTVTLVNTGLTVDYLKVAYTINDKLDVENSVIKINDMELKDSKNGRATANGKVDLSDFASPVINVDLEARNMMALNTQLKDNRIYYGTAYATGRFSFNGPIDNMSINIDAKTEDGTVFNIPLNTSATASDYEFIRFVSHRDSNTVVYTPSIFKGITLNFNLSVDEKTVVKITTDLGVLEGRGTANNLNLKINSLGDFTMFGDFLISSGRFEFTAKNFISKNFQVSQGGTIRWTSSPSNAEINLKAIYEVRANINDLYTAAGQGGKLSNSIQMELVQAQLNITHTLLQPVIDFDFNFPLNPAVKEDLNSYLSDVTNRNQQALSVIVRRQFAPGNNSNINKQVLGTATSAASEFFFNKLNAYLAQTQLTQSINLDLNVRSQSDASASIRFFNDRIVLNGSLYNINGSNDLFQNNNSNLFNSSFNNLYKDFSAEYLIRKDGQLRGRYSYRLLNNTASNTLNTGDLQQQYVNGLGLIYQRDFDSFGEFFRNIFRWGGKRQQSPKPLPVGTTTPSPSAAVITPSPKEEPEGQ